MFFIYGSTDEEVRRIAKEGLDDLEIKKLDTYFNLSNAQSHDSSEANKVYPHGKKLLTAVGRAGYDNSPTMTQLLFSVVYAAGPLVVLKYVSHKLAKDTEARKIKLKKEQGNAGANPLAALLMQLQRSQMGGGDSADDSDEIKLPDSAAPVAPEVLQWNPHDILTPGKRKFFTALLWIAKIASILGVVQLGIVLRDKFVRGNTIPAAMHNLVNQLKKATNSDVDAAVMEKIGQLVGREASSDDKASAIVGFDNANWGVRAGKKLHMPLVSAIARWMKFDPEVKLASTKATI